MEKVCYWCKHYLSSGYSELSSGYCELHEMDIDAEDKGCEDHIEFVRR